VVVWQKAKMADVRSGLLAVLGSSCVAHLLPCHQRQDQPEIVLDGFFPKPGADPSSTSSSTPEKTFIFINNRPVQHKEIMKLLRHRYSAQYSDDAARHRYPIVLLKVAVPPSSVDVNLTPDKTQVLLHNKEAVLTAVEALLVSLYGFRSPAEEGTFLSPSSPLQAESTGSADVSNCSSSSSVADDWIVSRGPAELQPDHETTAETSPGRLEDANISAEDWSRGTALTDPVSGEPLRPVVIQSGSGEARSPTKKTLNAVTEKRAALTVYDMISNRAARAPLSPAALFEKEARAEVLRERPAAGLRDVSAAVQERWKNLPEEDRKKYEEKAKRSVEHYDRRTKLASAEPAERTPRPKPPAQKRKAPLSNQQLLDELFSARPQKKTKTPAPPKPSRPLPCSVAALRLRLRRLSAQSGAAPRGLRLVNRLASQSAWVAVCGRRLMVLNSFRVEEALLFQRLLENHVLPAVSLQKPLQVTAGSLGGAEYVETLCSMEKRPADLSGGVVFSDPRLVANGFRIQLATGTNRSRALKAGLLINPLIIRRWCNRPLDEREVGYVCRTFVCRLFSFTSP
uniref:PMS1 homolog 1, mismatch repair system component n=1 Tax=Kryptolebias marmoratus TaxID=37003 RepID=A0A3Q3A2G4_KRYMA